MDIDALIAAYEHELAGYRRRGLADRAKLVEEELRRLGRPPGATPRGDVPAEPASTPTPEPDAPGEPETADKARPAPKRPTTRKKR
jgi:hypothetical protein